MNNNYRGIIIKIIFLLSCLGAVVHSFPSPPLHDAIASVQGIIQRRIPSTIGKFSFEIIPPSSKGFDAFEIEQVDNTVRLRGSSAVAMASALNWYLKNYVKAQMSWNAINLHMPHHLPPVERKVRHERQSNYTYYLNVCTVSYSMWSWNWDQWEYHIDWMALNGVNLPLAFTGQEKVWQNTFQKHFNVSQEGIKNFFSGPAFLAWNRMGNIQGNWPEGYLPQKFIENQYQLQVKILQRMKEFGMTPALPGFAGHIPEELHKLYPNAKVTKSPYWGGFKGRFSGVYVVEPTDPLFVEIAKKFIQEQRSLYDVTSSIYQMDTYNELDPTSSDLEYLANSSRSVYNGMKAADPKGTWLMQGWLFQTGKFWTNDRIEAYLSGVPNDGMIILDLYSDAVPVWRKTRNYFGKHWIYCLLHNFGGTVGIHGDLQSTGSDPIEAMHASNGTMLGIGLTMEGIFQNYVVYQLMLEMAWREKPVNVSKWLMTYAEQRYGSYHESTKNAWRALGRSSYNCTRCWGGVPKSVIERRPHLSLEDDPRGHLGVSINHDPKEIFVAWNQLLQSSDDLQRVDTFRYDLVDVTRQAISDALLFKYRDLMSAYKMQKGVCVVGRELLKMIQDMNWILLSCHQFLLGKWIHDARALGNTDEEKAYYEYQARNQVTRWGHDNNNALADYASKQWGGLVGDYYYKRWEIFTNHLCLQYKDHQPVNMTAVNEDIEKFEVKWQMEVNKFPAHEVGDPVVISKLLYSKYAHVAKKFKTLTKCAQSKAQVYLVDKWECID